MFEENYNQSLNYFTVRSISSLSSMSEALFMVLFSFERVVTIANHQKMGFLFCCNETSRSQKGRSIQNLLAKSKGVFQWINSHELVCVQLFVFE